LRAQFPPPGSSLRTTDTYSLGIQNFNSKCLYLQLRAYLSSSNIQPHFCASSHFKTVFLLLGNTSRDLCKITHHSHSIHKQATDVWDLHYEVVADGKCTAPPYHNRVRFIQKQLKDATNTAETGRNTRVMQITTATEPSLDENHAMKTKKKTWHHSQIHPDEHWAHKFTSLSLH